MSAMILTIFIPRDGETGTCAALRVACVHDMTVIMIKRHLIDALSAWAKTSEEGRTAWAASSGDFNIGDLAMIESVISYGGRPHPVRTHLRKNGIADMQFIENAVCEPGVWHYDSILMDDPEHEEETGEKLPSVLRYR